MRKHLISLPQVINILKNIKLKQGRIKGGGTGAIAQGPPL